MSDLQEQIAIEFDHEDIRQGIEYWLNETLFNGDHHVLSVEKKYDQTGSKNLFTVVLENPTAAIEKDAVLERYSKLLDLLAMADIPTGADDFSDQVEKLAADVWALAGNSGPPPEIEITIE